MARRRIGPKRSTQIAFDLNKMDHEIRMIILEEANGIIGELARAVVDEAKRLAPSLPPGEKPRGPNKRPGTHPNAAKSGPLKDMIFCEPSDRMPASWVVCSPTWYSHFVEYGTTPHEMPRAAFQEQIKNKQRKPMRFKAPDGRWITAKWLYHTGARAHPFLRPAADKAEQFLQEILRKRHP